MKKLLGLLSIFVLSITLIGVDKAFAATIYWPADSKVITSYYGNRTINGVSDFHRGIDVRGAVGANVYAMHKGTVAFAGWDSVSGNGSYGKVILINHTGANKINYVNVKSVYAHLNSWSVNTGNTVNGKQLIGTIGATGNVTGPHLHFETLNCANDACAFGTATHHNPLTWYSGFETTSAPNLLDKIERTEFTEIMEQLEATEMLQDLILDIETNTDRFYSLERLQQMTPEELIEIGYPDPYEFQ